MGEPFYLGVIPARGGSKRLPRKNVLPVGGKPLIGWAVESALCSALDAWLVSTDDVEIGETAQKYGAVIPFIRPPELSTDKATTASVLIHALDWYEDRTGKEVSHVVTLQPTSPLRRAVHVNVALMLCRASENATASGLYSASERGLPNGAVYITPVKMLRNDGQVWTHFGFEWLMEEPMPDVDTLEDLQEAEKLIAGVP